jgi:hypothetical protein
VITFLKAHGSDLLLLRRTISIFTIALCGIAGLAGVEAAGCLGHNPQCTQTEKEIFQVVCGADSGETKPAPRRRVTAKFLHDLILDNECEPVIGKRGLVLSNLVVEGPLLLSDAHLKNSIRISNSEFLSEIDLSGANISGSLSFLKSDLHGGLRIDGAHITGSLILGEEIELEPDATKPRGGSVLAYLKARAIRVDGDIGVVGEEVFDGILLDKSHIGGELNIVLTKAMYINLVSSTIENQVVIVDDDFRPPSIKAPMVVEPDMSITSINMYLMRAKQNVFLNRSITNRPIEASSAEIGSDLILTGTHLASLSADGIQIRGALSLGFNPKAAAHPRGPEEGPSTGWFQLGELSLRRASINAIVSPEDTAVWPGPGKLHLTNFHLSTFTPGYCASDVKCAHSPGWYVTWLRLDETNEGLLQRYQMMIDMLQARGDREEASYVGLARGDEQLWEAPWSSIKLWFGIIHRLTVGYGFYPERSIWCIIGFTVVGAFIYRRTKQAKVRGNTLGFCYSFDLLIPLIRLDEENYKVQLSGAPRYYFYFHRIAGWILASFLVAAIAGFNLSK